MNRKYKLLYIEDQDPQTCVNLLKEDDMFEVETVDAAKTDDTLDTIKDHSFDIFLMDFELTSHTGRVDAPTYASTLRTKFKEHKDCPIVLISSDRNIGRFKQDFSNNDLFDIVVTKEEFAYRYKTYKLRMYDLVEAYSKIKKSSFDISSILGVKDENVLDFRFVHYLKMYGENHDVYGICRFVQKTYLQSIGPLIGEDVVAARLGIDKECDDFQKLLKLLESYRYKGILSTSYKRWWADKIQEWWNCEFDGEFLRLMPAQQRVQALNSKFNLHLCSVNPLDFNRSSCYWSICNELKRPIDPNEGYVILNDKIYPWQEHEYYSLKSITSNSQLLTKLSVADRKKIIEYGQNIKEEQ